MDKRLPYETDLRIPFFARGPRIPPSTRVTGAPWALVDVAPTLLDMAGVDWAATGMDGRSMLPALTGEEETPTQARRRKDVLVEYRGEVVPASKAQCPEYVGDPNIFVLRRGPKSFSTPPYANATVQHGGGSCFVIDGRNHSYACLRTVVEDEEDSLFCVFPSQGGLVEYYNITADPWSLVNLAPALPPSELAGRTARLQRLLRCATDAECAGGEKGEEIRGIAAEPPRGVTAPALRLRLGV